jgi:hypothetical protein
VTDRKKWKDLVRQAKSLPWAVVPVEEEEEEEEEKEKKKKKKKLLKIKCWLNISTNFV